MLRVYWRGARLLIHVLWGLFLCVLICQWLPYPKRIPIVQHWSNRLLRILQLDCHLYGAPLPPPEQVILLTSNHISWIDVFVILALRPVRFVAKSEVKSWFVLGWMATVSGTLYLQRESRREVVMFGGRMQHALSLGHSLGLFPEGTTTMGTELLPFHRSLFEPVIAQAIPVCPVILQYHDNNGKISTAIPFVGEMTLWDSLKNILQAPPSQVLIRTGPLIETRGKNRKEVVLQIEAISQTLLAGQVT